MRNDFSANSFELTCYIASDIEISAHTTTKKEITCVGTFTVTICDSLSTPVPCIAYGDYAMKIKEYAPKGSKVTLWATGGQYHKQLVFKVVKMVLEKYPKEELSDGE